MDDVISDWGPGGRPFRDRFGRNAKLTSVVVVKEGVQPGAVHGEARGVDNAQTPADFAVSILAVAARGEVGIVDVGVRREGD